MFAVVHFLKDGSVDIVPSNWLDNDECFWPTNYKASGTIKAVKCRETPDSMYTKHDVIILSIEETYDKARLKLRKAEDTDDIATSTDQEKGRGKRKKHTLCLSSDESDGDGDEEGLRDLPPTRFKRRNDSSAAASRDSSAAASSDSSAAASSDSSAAASEEKSCPDILPCSPSVPQQCAPEKQQETFSVTTDNSLLILREICFVKKQLATVISLLSQKETGSVTNEECVSLPLKTEEELEEVEKKLQGSKQFQARMAQQLALIGGTTPQSATARILAKLLHDCLGQKYSLYGKKGKRPFANLQLFVVLQNAVRLTSGLASATLQQIEHGARGWLKNCPAWLQNAAKRNEQTTMQGEEKEQECP